MTQSLKDVVIAALEDVKAQNIIALDVRELTGVMDHMIVASGNSNRQVKSLASNVAVEGKKAGFSIIGVEGDDTSEWILVDFGDVIVHVMLPATRAFSISSDSGQCAPAMPKTIQKTNVTCSAISTRHP